MTEGRSPRSSHLLTVARFELLRRLRSRSLFVNAIVGPTALALVFGALIGGGDESTASFDVVIAADTSSAVASGIADGITGIDSDGLTTVGVDDRAAAVAAVEDDAADAAIVVAADGSMEVVGHAARPLSAQVAQAVADGAASFVQRSGESGPVVEELALGGRKTSAMAYFGASMAGLLLLFSAGLAARSVLEDRHEGRWGRLRSGGASPASLVGGKVLAVGTVSTVGFAVVWLVTSVVGGADWGDPVGVVLMIVATVVAMAGISMLLGSIARTPTQLDTSTAITAFVLGLIGGSFVPPADAPAALRTLRSWSPNGVSLEGFVELNTDLVGPSAVLDEVAVLVGIGLVLGLLGAWRTTRADAEVRR